MAAVRGGTLREMVDPSANETLKSNSHSCVKILKTAGEFVSKICAVKEQCANQLLSVVETFKRKSAEMKKERGALSSAMSLWETLLLEYETEAQDMLKLCSKLSKDISKSLSDEASKRKALYKKIFTFREAGEARISKADDARAKCHRDYCEACAKLAKVQNSADQSKEGKQEHYITMCHNAHNSYVLQLSAVNGMTDVFYTKTLPQMLDDLQAIQEETAMAMSATFKNCAEIERQNHDDRSKRLQSFEGMFELVNSSQDIENFVKTNNPGQFTPPKKLFEKPEDGTVVSVPDGKLSVHALTETVLKRKYITLYKKFRNLSDDVEKERHAIISVSGLKDSYSKNPSYGRADTVDANLLEQKNEMRLKEMYKEITNDQLSLFTPDVMTKLSVSDVDLQDEEYDDDESLTNIYDKRQSVITSAMAKPKTTRAAKHEFVEHNFRKPQFCYYCNKLLKGKKTPSFLLIVRQDYRSNRSELTLFKGEGGRRCILRKGEPRKCSMA
ncbi:predicted protein [Nematostella vectensis]|uniref:Uncharacterized protein n=1 Tax=Nematostella vectensis TaxID=45351 RepID=A7SIY7_NEMVE|nr:predicted protein [Nematostella vectensis]|eukprot:XP_001628366.1 predicted protein [Nematostella vectensis]